MSKAAIALIMKILDEDMFASEADIDRELAKRGYKIVKARRAVPK